MRASMITERRYDIKLCVEQEARFLGSHRTRKVHDSAILRDSNAIQQRLQIE